VFSTKHTQTLNVDVHFDVICPWCFIGLKRLDQAIALRSGLQTNVLWHPYFLNQDAPDRSVDFTAYIERKVGGSLRVEKLFSSYRAIGETLDIDFKFEDISCVPSTLDAHKLIHLAHTIEQQNNVALSLFTAYFSKGQDISDLEVLYQIGESYGLSEIKLKHIFDDEALSEAIYFEVEEKLNANTTGIPLFVFNENFEITGAHEPEVLVRLIDVAMAAGKIDLDMTASVSSFPLRSPPETA